MSREKTYNFAPGPAVLPDEVLERAKAEILDWNNSGMSVMELSHRGSQFIEIFNSTKQKFKEAMSIPDNYEILFCQGGATLQFSAVPMNLIGENGSADYCVTGSFAKGSTKEAMKYGRINIAADTSDCNHSRIPQQSELKLTKDASYFYYCSNNTIFGTEWHYVPETNGVPIVCDMSSDILSCPVDVSKYGVIFAGAQKNMAPAGLTMVVVDKALMGRELPYTPVIMSYKTMAEKDSMYNTPPCWCIYMLGLTLDWLKQNGGVEGMAKLRKERAGLVYDFLDNSKLFKPHAERDSRSYMNVTFRTGDDNLDAAFCKGAAAHGIVSIKGHRSAGGMRASLYNAQSMEGTKALVEYMKEFEVSHRG